MAPIQWRPEVNALTSPYSYKIRYLPRATIDDNDLAADVAAENPHYNATLVKSVTAAVMHKIQQHLINGNQVIVADAFTFGLSFTGRLNTPESALPDMDDMLHVKVHASPRFAKEVRHAARLERMPMITDKVPMIASVEDTLLKLSNVLNPAGILKMTGANLFSAKDPSGWECVLEGTRSGRQVQRQIGPIAQSSILLVPNLPAQEAPHHNEYILSIFARYTKNGPLRKGSYGRRLRSPLTVSGLSQPGSPATGILTGNADLPYVRITGGVVSADTLLRIQVLHDVRENHLLFNLLDIQNSKQAGPAVNVAGNGLQTLQGVAGSAVSSLTVSVDNYAALTELVRSAYAGCLVDVLDLRL